MKAWCRKTASNRSRTAGRSRCHQRPPALRRGEPVEGGGDIARVAQVALEAAGSPSASRSSSERLARLEQRAQQRHGARARLGHAVALEERRQPRLGIEHEAALVGPVQAAREQRLERAARPPAGPPRPRRARPPGPRASRRGGAGRRRAVVREVEQVVGVVEAVLAPVARRWRGRGARARSGRRRRPRAAAGRPGRRGSPRRRGRSR